MMISIITPVYNGEKFISSCLEVVINQNCPDVEHIIVDGGSIDATPEIIKQYAEKYSHIRWLSEPDQGQSDAMNKGIRIANSDIIGILNVDDFYQKGVLNRVLEIFKTLPEPSFLVGDCRVLDEQGKVKFVDKPDKLGFVELLLGPDINSHPVNPSAYFYHKSLHEKIGFYDVEEHYVMDVDFIYRTIQVANVKYVNEIWGNYRNIEGTKSYSGSQDGQGKKRVKALINKYQKQLPPLTQLRIICQRFWISKIWHRIEFYQRHPEEIFQSIGKKLRLRG